MAASSLDERYLELARSMEIALIPERIRCATCDKLAINAVKLPCCDSPVCSDCQQDKLPTNTECPICMHAPFAADMGVPAKSLQTTVKVFIKNEAKKRGIDLKTGAKIVSEATAPAEPADAVAAAVAPQTVAETVPVAAVEETEASEVADHNVVTTVEDEIPPISQTQDEANQPNGDADEKSGEQDQEDDDDDDDVVITTERPEPDEQQPEGDENGQYEKQTNSGGETADQNMQMDNNHQGFGFNQSMAGFGNVNFGNMNMGMNGFNPMMGMSDFGMGMTNMMGMPGMGMDPSMMFNGSFGGMGDMSMMGMGNMGGAMSGMGDFNGMGGPGFFPNQGNYMQSNYGNAHRQNFFNDRGYGRGYGRGFGRGPRGNQYGRGRGGWGYQQQHQYSQNQQYSQQQQVGGPQQSGANDMDVASRRRASPSYETGQGPDGPPAAPSGDKPSIVEASTHQDAGQDTNMAGDGTNKAVESADQVMENGDVAMPSQEDPSKNHMNENDGAVTADGDRVQSGDAVQMNTDMQNGRSNDFDDASQFQQQPGNDFNGRGGYRGGRGGYGFGRAQDSTELTPAPAPPINAPTGPKAMRQGLPNTGWAGRSLTQTKPTPTPAPEVKTSGEPADHERRHDELQDRGRSRSRSRSKRRSSRARERDGGYESDETYARRKERERRKRKEREERYDEERAASKDDEKQSKKYRSRSESRTDDSSRRRHRDKDDDYRSSRSHRDRSKDKHRRRHRSRSPVKDEGQDDHSRRKSKSHHERDAEHEGSDRYKDSKRSSRRHSTRDDDDYKEDRKHRSSKHDRSSKSDTRNREAERPRAVIEPPSDELGFKIKGSKSAKANKENHASMAPPSSSSRHDRRSSVQDTSAPASADPYAEERARAQLNREAREAERRISSSTSLGKRGRDDDETFDAPKGPKGNRPIVKKGRRVNYKYEDEVQGMDERDAGRWR